MPHTHDALDEATHIPSPRHLPQSAPAWVQELAQGLDTLRQTNFKSGAEIAFEGWLSESEYRPALDVGGDFYDVIPLPDGHFGVLIGDVAGKGEPAARVMTAARALLRAEAQVWMEPAQVLRSANNALAVSLPAGSFVTCFYMVIDAQTGYTRFANAGHTLPLKAYGDELQRLDATGFPLGILPGVAYDEADAWLEQGCTLFLYSDGIPEAHNAAREMFGFARMHEVVASYGRQRAHAAAAWSPAALLHMLHALEAFTGDAREQEDDITLLVLHRL